MIRSLIYALNWRDILSKLCNFKTNSNRHSLNEYHLEVITKALSCPHYYYQPLTVGYEVFKKKNKKKKKKANKEEIEFQTFRFSDDIRSKIL